MGIRCPSIDQGYEKSGVPAQKSWRETCLSGIIFPADLRPENRVGVDHTDVSDGLSTRNLDFIRRSLRFAPIVLFAGLLVSHGLAESTTPPNLSRPSEPNGARYIPWTGTPPVDDLDGAQTPRQPTSVVRGEVVVRFRETAGRATQQNAIRGLGVRNIRYLNSQTGAGRISKQNAVKGESVFNQLAVVTLEDGADIGRAIERLRNRPEVLYAEPNYRLKITESSSEPIIPNDFDFAQLWGLHNVGQADGTEGADIGATGAWQYLTGDKQVVVAVIDTGIDYYHPDLAANIWVNLGENPANGQDDDQNGYTDDIHGYDFVSDDGDGMDDHGHGTHVSGTVGAVGNNGIGIAGVCWQVSLMSIKAFDESGNGEITTAIEGIRYAIENGARIINASWGNNDRSQALQDAIREAHQAGALFIAAAGNDNSDALFFPGAYEHVIAVAATDAKDRRSRFSDFGSYVDIAAPGENIFSTLPNNGYGFYSGTSMSTPHVAGVAALVLSRHPNFSPLQIENILRNAVDTIVPDKYIGTGRINASYALRVNAPLPEVALELPPIVYGEIDITGRAVSDRFVKYTLEYGKGSHPTNWTEFFTSPDPVESGVLYKGFSTPSLGEGAFAFRLTAENAAGERAVERVSVQVSNVHIRSPNHNDILRAGGPLEIWGTVFGEGRTYTLQYGVGAEPTSWSDQGMERATTGPAAIRDGILAVWDTSKVTPNQFYTLKLAAKTQDGVVTEFLTRLIYLDSHLKPGWPQYLPILGTYPAENWRDLNVTDIDRDGLAEIILVDHGNSDGNPAQLLVYGHDGSVKWSRELGTGSPYADIPVVGDISGDGYKQIFVDAGGSKRLYAFHHDGQRLHGMWPIQLEVSGLGKALCDLNGDGMKELIGFSQETIRRGNSEYRQLVVYDADGRLLRRWEVPGCSAEIDAPRILPAVGHLDSEPDPEIVVVSGCDTVAAFKLSNPAGPIWEAETYGTFAGSPVIGDLDGNGTNEVVIAAFDVSGGKRGGVYAFDNLGNRLPGWPVLVEESFSAAPALGDVNGDGRLEISLPSWKSGLLHLIQLDGFEVAGWPVGPLSSASLKSSSVIGDVDGDGHPDVVLSAPGYLSQVLNSGDLSKAGGVRAWAGNGQPIALNANETILPLVMESSGGVWQKAPPPVLADIDANGKLDIIAASIQDRTYLPPGEQSSRKNRSSLYIWELDTPFNPERSPWPMRQRTSEHTGYLPAPKHTNQPPVTLPIPSQIVPAGGQFFPIDLSQYVEDPDHASSEISWAVTNNVELMITIGTNRIATILAPSTWTGQEIVRFIATDPAGGTSEVSATFEARAGYIAPTALSDRAETAEDISVEIRVLANDTEPNGAPLTISGVSRAGLGKVTIIPGGILLYEPQPDANGVDSFSYIVTNGKGGISMGLVTVEIQPVPDLPVVNPDHLVIDEDTAGEVDVLANDLDPDTEPLRLLDFQQPENGAVTRTADGRLVYQPKNHYFGRDQFVYSIADAQGPPVEGSVQIIVKPVNDPPRAEDQNFVLNRNASQNITFTAVDPDDAESTFSVVESPKHGTLWNYPKVATYYPTNGFSGEDSFTYRANDGKDDGPIATIHFQVLDVNNPPDANELSVVTKVDQPAEIHLSATDLDNDPLTYTIITPPAQGTLSGSDTNYTYQPTLGFLGKDSFIFQVSDGKDLSELTRVNLTVTDQNTAPAAIDSVVRVLINTPTNVTLRASDPESNPLNYHVVTRPLNGKLSGKGEILLYSPNPFFTGSDRFTFKVDDGELESQVGTVSITVDAANHRPVATNQTVTVLRDTPTAITLAVEDPDGDALHSPILKGPKNGRLAGAGTSFVYTPKPGFLGSDSFTFKSWDGQIYSVEGTVSISVSAAAPATPVHFTDVQLLPDGSVQVFLSITGNVKAEVLVSTDLINWVPLPGQVAHAGNPSVIDNEASSSHNRFYRARHVETP